MKTVYFVRHGESEANATRIRQGSGSHLTKKGLEQSRFLGKRLAALPIDVIISSTHTRALETAEEIRKIINKKIEKSELLVERRQPSETVGKLLDAPETLRIAEEIKKNRLKDESYKYADEESFFEIKQRASEAIRTLEKHTAEHILVVTHGFFLRYIMAVMILGEELSVTEFSKFSHFLYTTNTGITVCTFEPEKHVPTKGWALMTWNDYTHLGDM